MHTVITVYIDPGFGRVSRIIASRSEASKAIGHLRVVCH